ncbi:MAG: hypothetical protein K1Y36_10915 [Blastocatellia bacterium]|nr:hypothetical protein [Blastocatellia bacterium]
MKRTRFLAFTLILAVIAGLGIYSRVLNIKAQSRFLLAANLDDTFTLNQIAGYKNWKPVTEKPQFIPKAMFAG